MNIEELFGKYAKFYVTHADLPLISLENFTQAIAEIISNPVEAEVKQVACGNCISCKHYIEDSDIDQMGHTIFFGYCKKLEWIPNWCGKWDDRYNGCNKFEKRELHSCQHCGVETTEPDENCYKVSKPSV